VPLQAETFAEVPPEPPIEVVDTIAARIKASGADAVIALGGGSVMDAAKVASLCARHNKAAREFVGIGKAGGRGLPTVLIPTTAGTGSEATLVAILTDPVSGNKVGVVDPCILADIAIVDPALTDGLPVQVTASAGMDALVHAIEGFIARVATPLARGLALEAARRIGRSLETVFREPGNTAAGRHGHRLASCRHDVCQLLVLRRARAGVAFRRTLSHPAWRYHRLLRGGNDAPQCVGLRGGFHGAGPGARLGRDRGHGLC
jgi:alcohol dehydrogenase class IV